jgi:hypothetical protein
MHILLGYGGRKARFEAPMIVLLGREYLTWKEYFVRLTFGSDDE